VNVSTTVNLRTYKKRKEGMSGLFVCLLYLDKPVPTETHAAIIHACTYIPVSGYHVL